MIQPSLKLKTTILLSCFLSSLTLASNEVYKYTRADGAVVFSDLKPQVNSYETLKFDCYACQVNSTVNWTNTPLYKKYDDEISSISHKYGLEQSLIRAVIHAESSFNPKAVSKVGAQGLMQLMPETAKELGVNKPFNAKDNIDGGTRYLKKLLVQFNGKLNFALAAYNAGASNVKKYNGIPPFKETQAYIKRIAILHSRYKRL